MLLKTLYTIECYITYIFFQQPPRRQEPLALPQQLAPADVPGAQIVMYSAMWDDELN